MARGQEFRQPKGVVLEAKIESELFDEPAEVAVVEQPKADSWQAGWTDLPEPHESFPFNGQPVLVTADRLVGVPAVWRATRSFSNGRWSNTAFWAKRNHGGMKLGFVPVAYRKIVE